MASENETRATRAKAILVAVCLPESLEHREDVKAAAVDVIADLLHYMQTIGFDGDAVARIAADHYNAERRGAE